VLSAGAVLRVAFGVFYGLGDPPGEDPRMAAEANEETGETESGRQRTPLTMLAPLGVLVASGLAAGILALVPRFAASIEAAAVRFQDQAAYAATVLHGASVSRPVSLYAPAPPDVTAAAVVTALCSAAGAALLALTALYWRRLPAVGSLREHWPRDRAGTLTLAVNRFQSGILNDYITWLVTGVATLGGVLALIIR
jgi:multicomponent Na+:H+ antiporter subunit D